MAGLVIDAAGIPPGSDPATVSAEAVARFGWLQGPSVLLLTAVSVIAILYYRISKARHAEIRAEIGTKTPNSVKTIHSVRLTVDN